MDGAFTGWDPIVPMEEGVEGVSRSQTRLTSKGGVRSLEDRVETVEILGSRLSLIKIYSPKHVCNAKWHLAARNNPPNIFL